MPHTTDILFDDGAVKTVLMDSVSYIVPENRGDIIISGSHGGTSSAGYAVDACAGAVFFNDAGCGKNGAGIKGLEELEKYKIIAAAVSHESAEIANAVDTYHSGIVTHVNEQASRAGLRPSMPVTGAVDILRKYFSAEKS